MSTFYRVSGGTDTSTFFVEVIGETALVIVPEKEPFPILREVAETVLEEARVRGLEVDEV